MARPTGTRHGCRQLQALLWRQRLLSGRSWVTTLVQLLSPVVMLSALVGLAEEDTRMTNLDSASDPVLAYALVVPEYRPEHIRILETQQALQDLSSSAQSLTQGKTSQQCLDLWESLNSTSWDEQGLPAEGSSSTPAQAPQYTGQNTMTAGITDGQQDLARICLQNATAVVNGLASLTVDALQRFIDRNGPIPILTLDEFILVHKLLQAAFRTKPEALNTLRNVRSSLGRNILGNLSDMGQLAFAPATPDVLRFAAHMEASHEFFSEYFYGVFATEAEAESYALTANPRLWALVVFQTGPNAAGSEYTIRQNYTTVPSSSQRVNVHSHGVPRGYKRYYTSGFLSLQAAIDGYSLGLSAIEETSVGPVPRGAAVDTFTAWGSIFPTASYDHNDFYDAVGPMLGLLMSLSLIYPLSMLVRGIVEEKESRAKETMSIMGLKSWVLPVAWAITYALMFAAISALITLICCLSFLRTTDPILLFLVLLLFTASELSFGLLVASIFSNAKIAAISAPILHFSALMPRYIFFRAEESQAVAGKVVVSLLSPSAFTFAGDLFAEYEGGGHGLTSGQIWEDPYPLGAIMLILAGDCLLYALIAWYLERTLPSQYGGRLPLYFPLTTSYWRHGYVAERTTGRPWTSYLPFIGGHDMVSNEQSYNMQHIEGTSLLGASQAAPAVDIAGLRKVYGQKVAVKGLTMSMGMGEITALLGHNGAGKSTVVGVIAGLLRPTAGDCRIMGHSIVHEPAVARRCLGYCPQQNVLFSRLTVLEHLQMYGALKGIPGGIWSKQTLDAANKMLQAVGLEDKQDTEAQALSGGMKRKLQVAIALLGDSPVVLLDEPTSGVDPVSRRALWAILSKAKHSRAILLITHYCDEADVLSDQVAIMAEGELRCMGSTLDLKHQYSDGYMLSLTMEVDGQSRPDLERITQLIETSIPGAYVLRSAAAELVYRLPMRASGSFANMLDHLERRRNELNLSHYAISMPTLEEAFLQCNDMAHQEEPRAERPSTPPAATVQPQMLELTPASRDTWRSSTRHDSDSDEDSKAPSSRASRRGQQNEECNSPAEHSTNRPSDVMKATEAPANGHVSEDSPTGGDALGGEPGGEHVGKQQEEEVAVTIGGTSSQSRSMLTRSFVALGLVIRKRAVMAVRDKKAILFALVLPVVAVSLVMLILKVNIDPSAPTMLLDLSVPPQTGPISSANLPAPLLLCNGSELHSSGGSPCLGGLAFMDRGTPADGLEMNHLLLQDIAQGFPAQYAAVVFNDTVLQQLAGPDGMRSSIGNVSSRQLQGLLLSALPALLPSAGISDGLSTSTLGGTANQAALFNLALSREARVFRRMQARFSNQPPINLMHNASSSHALPALLSGLHEIIGALNSDTSGVRPRFVAKSHPLPLSVEESVGLDSILMVLAALFVLVPFCLLSGAFCMNPVVERISSAQHMQLLSGCPAPIYWLGSYIWDLGTHLLVSLASLAIFAAYQDKATVGSLEQAFGTFLVLFAYGAAVIWLSYLYSFGFGSPSAAQVAAAALNFVLGFVAVNASYVMALIPRTQNVQKVLVHFFRITPPFLLGESLVDLTRHYYVKSLLQVAAQQSAASSSHAQAQAPAPAGTYAILADVAAGLQGSYAGATAPAMSLSDGQNAAMAVVPSAGTVFKWDVLGRPLTLLLLETFALCLLTLLTDQYARTATLPWPLQWVPEACRWAGGHLWRARSFVAAIMACRREANSSGGYRRVIVAEAELDLEAAMEGGVEVGVEVGARLKQGAEVEDQEDELVVLEKRHLSSGQVALDAISLQHVRKVYPGQPPKVALHDLCLSIKHGERFGLLGANGAGKTTTLGVLTGRIMATSGDALVNGISVLHTERQAGALLGYCPQVDPLLDLLTAREQLAMYARLKGVSKEMVDKAVEEVLRRVTIPDEMTRRPSGQYSGGNKRKLALGMALVGGVGAVLLDEPSSGMDPGSRRAMWRFITEGLAHQSGPSVSAILTTHSMEECEALCSRVGLLHMGRLRCVGTPARLKAVYGTGFLLEVHAPDDKELQYAIAKFVADELKGTVTEVQDHGRAKFLVPTAAWSLALLFRKMEGAKHQLGILTYGLSMPTLEQVFLNVVGEHLQV